MTWKKIASIAILLCMLMSMFTTPVSAAVVDTADTGANVELADVSANVASGTAFYFDDTNNAMGGAVTQVMIGHSTYSTTYEMTLIRDNLYYVSMPQWDGCTEIAIISADSNWGESTTESVSARKVWAPYSTGVYSVSSDLSGTQVFYSSGSSDISKTTTLNTTQTAYACYQSTGGGSYSTGTTGGTVSVSGYSVSGSTATSKSSSTSGTGISSARGTSVTMTATAATGYSFVGWYSSTTATSAVSTSSSYTYTNTGSAQTLYAKFQLNGPYTVTVQTSNSSYGTVSTSATSAYYGKTVTLTATPKTGYHLSSWSITSGTGSLSSTTATSPTLTVKSAITVKATFAANTGKVTFSAGTGGSVSSTGGSTTYSGTQSSTATASTGYYFTGWTISGGTLNTDYKITSGSTSSTSITIQPITNGATITCKANFGSQYKITTQQNYGVLGSVTKSTTYVTPGDTVTLTATADSGNGFNKWTFPSGSYTITSGSLTSSTITIKPTSNITAQANFYAGLTISAGTGGTVSPSGKNLYSYNTAVTITATPNTGYHFTGWTFGGTYSGGSTSSASTTIYVQDCTTAVANFAINTYTVTFVDYDGTVLKTQTVNHGSAATAPSNPTRTATAQYTYTFSGWDKTFSSVTGDMTVTAQYTSTVNKYTVTFVDWDGTVLNTQLVAYGSAATAPSDPTRTGYEFTGWDTSYSNITGATTVTATYKDVQVYLMGDFNSWQTTTVMTTSNGVDSVTIHLEPGTYSFKLLTQDVWYGNDGTIVDTTTSTSSVGWEMSSSAGNCTLSAFGGYYTFNYNTSTGMLEVIYDPDRYTVTFFDWDGTVLQSTVVMEGSAATAPATPTRTGDVQYSYTFSGWDKSFSNVQSTLDITAQYTQSVNKYTVTFKNYDGTVLSTQSVAYGSAATAPSNPTRTATAQYTYTFAGWDTDFSNITGDLTVTATYTSSLNYYTVTFKDWDGTVLKTQSVAYGSSATAPSNPSRAATAQYTYTFAGWDKSYSNITGALTVTATYTASVNYYTVTFKDWDGIVLKTQSVAYGSSATAPSNPSRAATAQYTYTFAGWDKSYSNITGALTVTATYTASVNYYTVTFVDWDGTVLKTQSVAYGSSATAPSNPSRAATAQYTYTFAGWDKSCTNITGALTVTATYTASVNYYTVTFKDWDGTVLKTQSVAYGSAATAPSDPTRAGYDFTGWDKSFSNITADLTVTATYEESPVYLLGDFNSWTVDSAMTISGDVVTTTIHLEPGTYTFKLLTQDVWYGNDGTIVDTTLNTSEVGWEMSSSAGNCTLSAFGGEYTFNYNTSTKMLEVLYTPDRFTVTFFNWDGTVLQSSVVMKGASATAPSDPTKEGDAQYSYTFTGWDKSFSNVQSTLDITAQYSQSVNKYTVAFVDWDDTVLKTQSVEYGSAATAPSDPVREGDSQYTYTFAGWDTDFSNITGDLTVKALYTPSLNKYTVAFVNYDGTVLKTQTVEHGSSATAPSNPTKPATAQYTYTFSGWDKSFTNVTSDLTVTAQYTSTVNKYTVTFVNYDGTTLSTQSVSYGSSATAPSNPTRPATAQYTYTFSGWDKDFSNITGDLTVTAQFTSTLNEYTVTFVDYDGTVLSTQSVEYGKSATAPTSPTRDGYEFTGWDKSFSNITADLTVIATYEESAVYLMGDFNSWTTNTLMTKSGDVVTATLQLEPGTYAFKILTQDVWYGNYGTIVDTTLTTSSVGWEMVDGYGNCTLSAFGGKYTFNYNTSTRMLEVLYTPDRFAVTFFNWDGTVLQSSVVLKGAAATAPATPTKEGDAQYSYTFAGWDTDFSNIQATTDVTATFTQSVNSYTVTFVDYDGTVLKTQSVAYGSSATAPSDPTREDADGNTYTFTGWDKDFSNITEDLTVVAQYSSMLNEYTVTFVDYDGTVLSTQTVSYGSAATAPENPTREGYEFIGWDKEFSSITADTTVTAQYKDVRVFLVGDFNSWATDTVMTESGDVVTTTIHLEPGTYAFKILTQDVWYGNYGTIVDTTTTTSDIGWEMVDGYGNCTLSAFGGEYTFNYNTSTGMLEVLYTPDRFTVTFFNYDGTVLQSSVVLKGTSATAPANPTRTGDAQYSYTFAGWDTDFSSIQATTDVTATFTQIVNSYTVKFVDWDGTLLQTQTVEYGKSATAPADPTREESDGNTYTFTGWDKDFSNITGDLTVSATYSSSGNTYTVIFKDYDGTVLSTQTVVFGESAEEPAAPSREADAQYTYTFAGWDKDFTNITTDTVITAVYTETLNKYTVTFIGYGGTTLSTQSVSYGSAATAPETPDVDGYEFIGWDTDFSYITGDITVTAKYVDPNVYLLGSFNNWTTDTVMSESSDGIVTVTITLEAGTYTFKILAQDIWYGNYGTIEDTTTATSDIGWEMFDGAGDCTLEATGGNYTFTFNTTTRMLVVTYEIEYFTVTFVDYDGTVLKTEELLKGESATAPEDPFREADAQYTYTFSGWDVNYSGVQSDLTVTATYNLTVNKYTVTFVDWDGTVLSTQEVDYGSAATEPEVPSRESTDQCTYTFAGWDKDFYTITGNTTVTATYTSTGNFYDVVFKNWDGSIIYAESVEYGSTATAPANPTRESDSQYSYTFAGWDTDYSYIVADTTVTATYTATVNEYTVTFVNYDGSVLKAQTVEYGAAATAPANPTRPSTNQYTFTFDGWDTDYSYITANTIVTATYIASVNSSSGSLDVYNLATDVQNGQILQCWNWSYYNIKNKLQDIASQGFSAIQVSPIQATKETTSEYYNTVWNSSWVVYQPVSFSIETNSFNALGTKSDFEAMCAEAHKYGIKVIVDTIFNHTANDMSENTIHPWVPSEIKDNSDCWHDITQNIWNFDDRYEVTQYCLTGLPDLNTSNKTVQQYCINFMKEAIDAGADGFRFDAAKHIETDWDADGIKSDFWYTVLGEATSYAQSTRSFTPYYYGEFIGAPSGVGVDAYTRYMSVTDTGANSIREAVCNGDAAAAASSGITYGESPSQAVLWTESHDNYKDDGTRYISDHNINKTWALVGSRAEACGLYLARPSNIETTLMGDADVTSWSYPEVKAINQFKNYFVGQSEYLSSYNNLACVERGTTGIVIVNLGGTYYNGMSAPVHTMEAGLYTDAITGNVFTVSDGYIYGDIGDTGIAVVYNVADSGPFTTGATTDVSLVGSFNDWDSSRNVMVANDSTTASTTVFLKQGTYTFKLTTATGLWYGNSGTITNTTDDNPWTMYANVSDNCTLVASGGRYTFTFDSTTGKLSVEYEADYDYKSSIYLKGDFNSWGTANQMEYLSGNNIVSTTITLTAGTYSFKLNNTDTNVWYSNSGTIVDTTSTTAASGWDMSMDVSGNCTLQASGGTYTFNYNISTGKLVVLYNAPTCTVTFVDYDGTVLSTQTVTVGDSAAAPASPYREADAQYTYTFVGWDKSFTSVTADMTVTAKYSTVTNSYTVTFVDYDGTVISSQTVAYGSSATAPEDPTREGDEQYSYTFAGWDADYSYITGDLTVTATYTQSVNTYTVTFVDYDGTVLATETVAYGASATAPSNPTRENDAQYTHTFKGWKGDYSSIKADATVTATYTTVVNAYTVEFVDYDGTVLSTQVVEYGSAAATPDEPSRDGYVFAGWDNDFTSVKADMTVTATYVEEDIIYTVIFKGYDGEILKTQQVNAGEAATAPTAPEIEGMEFDGWDTDFSKVTDNITVTARYVNPVTYLSGDFNGWASDAVMTEESDGVVSLTLVLEAGTYSFKLLSRDVWYGNAGVIDDTTRNTSDIGWEMYGNADNCTLVASGGIYTFRFNTETKMLEILFTPPSYTVTFVDFDGTILSTQVVERGFAAATPDEPSRDGYLFTGWDTEFTNVQADITVTATYILKKITYTVIFLDYDGTVLSTQIVTTGEAATEPTVSEREGYEFLGWDKDFSNITYNLTVTALYRDIRYYLIGSFNEWATDTIMTETEGSDIVTVELELKAGVYYFKLLHIDSWYGNTGNIVNTTLDTSDIGWEMVVDADNCTLTASGGKYTFNFNKTTNMLEVIYTPIEYTVTFVDYDGTILSTQTIAYGASATAPSEPEREGYFFYAWDKEFSDVESDTVVTATYVEDTTTYTVTFVDYDGTVLSVQEIPYGEAAVAPTTPERQGYLFSGWDKDFGKITESITVTAQYRDNHVYIYGSFNEWAEGVAMAYTEDSNIVTYELTLEAGIYYFKLLNLDSWYGNTGNIEDTTLATSEVGWEMVLDADNCTLTASGGKYVFSYTPETKMLEILYTPIEYTVVFKDFEGETVSTQTVKLGADATAPEMPEVEGYIFSGWDKDFTGVNEDIEVNAVYIKDTTKYTVTFVDYDGTVISTQQVEYGQSATAPSDPERTGYIFLGWDKEFSNIKADTTVTAQYKDNQIYLVGSFNDWATDINFTRIGNSDVFYVQLILEEGSYFFKLLQNDKWYTNASTIIDTTDVSSSTGIEFTSDSDMGDTILNASGGVYTFKFDVSTNKLVVLYSTEIKTYTVTFVDYDGTVLYTQEVNENTAAVAPSAPERESDAQYTYTFAGWDTDFSSITGDLTVTATYSKTINRYTVTFVDTDGTVLSTQTVEYGSGASAPEVPAKTGYIFQGWDKDFSYITEDLTVTAKYTAGVASSVTLAGTFNSWDSSATPFLVTTDSDKVTLQLKLEEGTYQFKVVESGTWYGNWGTIADTTITTSETGWVMDTSAGDCTLVAGGGLYTFTYTISTHTLEVLYVGDEFKVTFVDWDGTVLKTEVVEPGGSATAPEGTFTRPEDDGYTYEFAGWDMDFTNVIAPLRVTAVYTATAKMYTVKFVNWDGTLLSTQTVAYGSAATAPSDPTRTGYIFSGWDGDIYYITGNTTFTAQYTDNGVYIMGDFNDWQGTKLTLVSGTTYKGSITLSAGQYKFKVKQGDNWYGNNGTIDDTTTYTSDAGWEMTWDAGDCTLNASGSTYTFIFDTETRMLQILYVAPTYTVTFKNWNGTVLKTQYVTRGNSAYAPADPTRTGYVFTGWDKDFSWIYEDTVVTATFAENSVYVMGDFNDWNGTVMSPSSDTVYTATIELAAGTYKFKIKHIDTWYGNNGTIDNSTVATSDVGWEMIWDAGDCTLNATGGTYTFRFNTETRMLEILYVGEVYTVTFVDWDGSIISTQQVEYGQSAVAPATPVRDGYTFSGWSADFSYITGDATIMAQYGDEAVYLRGTFNDWQLSSSMRETDEANIYTYVIELSAGTYTFKVFTSDIWYGNNGTIEDTTLVTSAIGWEMDSSAGDCTLVAQGGTYLFRFNTETRMLEILCVTEDVTVTFVDYDGTVIETQTIKYGTAATAPTGLVRDGYVFVGWDTAIDYVTESITVTALYRKSVALQGISGDGDSSEMTYAEGTRYEITVSLEAGVYSFSINYGGVKYSLDNTFADSTEGLTLTEGADDITLIANGGQYTISFDTETKILTVVRLSDTVATDDEIAPEEPDTGDDAEPDNPATGDEIESDEPGDGDDDDSKVEYFVVIYINADGTYIGLEYVASGGDAARIPTASMAADAQYTYKFKGWNSELTNITSDVVATAVYDKLLNTYTVTFVDKDGNKISSSTVDYGNSVTAPTAPEVEGYKFIGWDVDLTSITSSTTATAQYQRIVAESEPVTTGRLQIDITGGASFTISIDGGTARTQGASYYNSVMPIASTVTVVASTTSDNEFLGWINVSSGVIVSTSETYTFVTTGNNYIEALYKTCASGVNLVIFKNGEAASGNGQILDMQYYAAGDTIVVPVSPTRAGHYFAGWDMSTSDIQAALANGEDVIVLATWKVRKVYVSITVTGGTVTSSGGKNALGNYLAYNGTTVTADTAPEGQKFAYWTDASGNIVSYYSEYTFYPSQNTELIAVFVDEAEIVEMQVLANIVADSTTTGDRITWVVSWSVPESVGTFVAGGILLVETKNYNPDTFVVGTTDSNVTQASPASAQQADQNGYGLNKSKSYVGTTWYGVAWVQYKDEDGVLHTVYSELVECTKY